MKIQAFWLFLEGSTAKMIARIRIWRLIINIMMYFCYRRKQVVSKIVMEKIQFLRKIQVVIAARLPTERR